MSTDGINFWQGRLVRLRGVEPSDAETFARWTGKGKEAEVFLNWLTARLGEAALDLEEASGENLDEGTDEGAGEPGTLP